MVCSSLPGGHTGLFGGIFYDLDGERRRGDCLPLAARGASLRHADRRRCPFLICHPLKGGWLPGATIPPPETRPKKKHTGFGVLSEPQREGCRSERVKKVKSKISPRRLAPGSLSRVAFRFRVQLQTPRVSFVEHFPLGLRTASPMFAHPLRGCAGIFNLLLPKKTCCLFSSSPVPGCPTRSVSVFSCMASFIWKLKVHGRTRNQLETVRFLFHTGNRLSCPV